MKKSLILLLLFIAGQSYSFSQDTLVEEEYAEEEPKTFASTRIVSGHSVETLEKGIMDFRIEHRFGDIAGSNGGFQNMFGFDMLSDMRIALEYGITDNIMIGFGRCKGTGAPYRSLLDGFAKYRFLTQKKNEMPISMALIAGSSFTYMKASTDLSQVNSFPKVAHRFAYFTQLNVARHFGEKASLALMPTYVHRNYVAADDVNDLFALGGAFRVKLTSRFAIVGEYYQTFANKNFRQTGYKNSLGIALEWFTFGHSFTINLTNAAGLGETQFIPYTFQSWGSGQFRFGFSVSRKFAYE
ncbi:MAG: hypothetical protein RLZZ531_884 [Bacteroidota bacterium]|jgi:hypothetical protein